MQFFFKYLIITYNKFIIDFCTIKLSFNFSSEASDPYFLYRCCHLGTKHSHWICANGYICFYTKVRV